MHHEKLLRDALTMWTTIDPIATLVVFASLTTGMTAPQRRVLARDATLFSALILVAASVLGQVVLNALGISMVAFQAAGGIVLFLFALQLVFGSVHTGETSGGPAAHPAVFPLAVPSIASPGAILAAIVLTDNHLHGFVEQLGTALVTLGVLGLNWLLMLGAERILRVIGQHGAALVIRVMGLILAALSVQFVIEALGIQTAGAVRIGH